MIVVDKLCYTSKLRYVNPYEKFFFAVLTLIFVIVSRSTAMGAAVIAMNSWLTMKKGGIRAAEYGRLMMIPLAFLLLSTLAIVINFSPAPLDAFGFRVGETYITGSFEGIERAVRLTVTAMGAVSCLYFLSLNTTMTDILTVLSGLRCPALLSELMLLIYRYIFVLLDTAYYISVAQNARLGNVSLRARVKSFTSLVQTLFIRSIKRSAALYDAMESRCYDGSIRVLKENRQADRKDITAIVAVEMILLVWTAAARIGIIG